MSSTSNAQDLLVNVFRPTYRWDSNTGFVPSLTLSNVTEIITGSVTTDRLAVSDSNLNTYIGSNAGATAIGTASNVGLGYSAMAGALNSSNNVAVGMFSLDGLSNSDCNVALGARTDITGRGTQNVLIGPNVSMGDGSGNILIGVDISAGNITKRFQLGTLLYGDLSSGYLGVNTTAPTRAFDVSGVTVFRGKVGFQNDNPVYSLDVNGSIGVSERFIGSNGSVAVPIYSFGDSNASNSGLFVPTDASYGLGAVGVSVRGQADMVIASNKTYIYNGLDVCGIITSSGGSASFLAGAGTISQPAYSFSGTSNLGLYRTTDASGSAVGIAVGGTSRFVVGSNKVTIFGNMDVCGAFSAVSGGGGSGGGTIAANGSAAAPSFTFSNDSTTGLYLVGSNRIGVSTGGVLRVCISGNLVGVGTATPQFGIDVSGAGVQKIQVSGQDAAVNIRDQRTTDPFVVFQNNNNQGFFASNALPVWMYQSNAVRMAISNGNVGIGTTAPTSTLDVSGVATLCNTIVTGALRNALTPTTYDISGGNISNSGTTRSSNFIGTSTASNQIGGVTMSNFDLCMSSAGRILGMPEVSNAIGGMTLSNGRIIASGGGAAAAPAYSFSGATQTGMLHSGGFLQFAIGGATRFQTSADTTTVSNQLAVTDGTAAAPGYAFTSETGLGVFRAGSAQLALATGGSNRMVISNSNVGIGTSAPAALLDVSGTIRTGCVNGNELTDITAYNEIGGGVNGDGVGGLPAIAFQGRDGASGRGYRHFIQSVHSGGVSTTANGIRFYICSGGTANASTAPGTGNKPIMAVTQLGVGIGHLDPTLGTLDISSPGTYGIHIRNPAAAGNIGIRISNGFGGTGDLGVAGANGAWTGGAFAGDTVVRANCNFHVEAKGVTRMTATNVGVGIGTNVPGVLMDVSVTDAIGLRVGNGNASGAFFQVSTAYTSYANVDMNGYLSIYRAGTTNRAASNVYATLSCEPGGYHTFLSNNVGVGVRVPGTELDVSGTTRSTTLVSRPSTTSSIGGIGLTSNRVAVGTGTFGSTFMVAVGQGTNTLAYSTNSGVSWVGLGTSIFTTIAYDVAWNGSIWVACGAGTNGLAYSYDGINWVGVGTSVLSAVRGVAWSGTRWVAVGNGANTIAYSADGITWTGTGTTVFSVGGNFVAWGGSQFVAVGDGTTNTVATSPDGITWTGRAKPFSSYGTCVAYNGSLWVATGVGTADTLYTSTDGSTWTSRTFTGGTNSWSVAWNGSLWVIGAQGTTKIFTSTDGLTWTGQTTTNFGTVVGMSWNGAFWVASTDGTTKIATSPDGVTWTARDTGTIFSTGSWFTGSQRFTLPITAGNGLVFDASGGNLRVTGRIGIGSTVPAYPLDVDGQGHFRDAGLNSGSIVLGDTVGPFIVQRDTVGHGYVRPTAAANLYLGTSNTNWVTLTNAGNFGIGTGAPAYMLDVCGTIRALEGLKQGTNTWGAYSDQRIKQNIERADISLCYSIMKDLPLQRFTWDASYLPNLKDKNVVGWVAQDVEKVFKRAVTTTPDFGFDDLRILDVDQLYKTMYGALGKVIADKEVLEAKMNAVLARLATLEASQQSSESTQTTPPTPPPPSESPESSPEPQQPPSSEYAPAPATTEA